MNPDAVDEARADDARQPPEDRDVIDGPALAQLNQGTLLRQGQRFDVTPPSEKPGGEKAFGWSPGDLRLPLDTILDRYDPQTRADFTAFAEQTDLGGGVTLLESLQ
jgi:hypothetical protein